MRDLVSPSANAFLPRPLRHLISGTAALAASAALFFVADHAWHALFRPPGMPSGQAIEEARDQTCSDRPSVGILFPGGGLRSNWALALYQTHVIDTLLITGAEGPETDSQFMRHLVRVEHKIQLQLDYPPRGFDRILQEKASENTFDNAANAAAFLADMKGVCTIFAITDADHMGRAEEGS